MRFRRASASILHRPTSHGSADAIAGLEKRMAMRGGRDFVEQVKRGSAPPPVSAPRKKRLVAPSIPGNDGVRFTRLYTITGGGATLPRFSFVPGPRPRAACRDAPAGIVMASAAVSAEVGRPQRFRSQGRIEGGQQRVVLLGSPDGDSQPVVQ